MAINEKVMSKNKKIGYARVSKYDQNLKMQLDALKEYGCVEQNLSFAHLIQNTLNNFC